MNLVSKIVNKKLIREYSLLLLNLTWWSRRRNIDCLEASFWSPSRPHEATRRKPGRFADFRALQGPFLGGGDTYDDKTLRDRTCPRYIHIPRLLSSIGPAIIGD